MATVVYLPFKLTALDKWHQKAISATVRVMQKHQQTTEGNDPPPRCCYAM